MEQLRQKQILNFSNYGGFRVNATIPKKTRKRNALKRRERNRRILRERQQRVRNRIANCHEPERDQPMMTAKNIHYELADRVQGLAPGGIGAMFLLATRIGLINDIDRDLHLLKKHLPYHESDHVLNIALNILAGGRNIEHLELLRNDVVYLDALGARRIPDPTTAGDFCRRFSEPDVVNLMDAINKTRLRVWAQQPPAFFKEAILDVDGTLVGTDAECKQGVDISYNGIWSYHPLLISLANTAELLYLVNRSGNRPSHEGAAEALDKMIAFCRQAGFERITLRGDTDFSQTTHLDRWDEAGDVQFVFGMDKRSNLVALAEALPAEEYGFLERPLRYAIKTVTREKPERVKAEIVRERGYRTIHLLEEMVAEFHYSPVACKKSYRVVVLRKRVGINKGKVRLSEEYRYHFYITNDWIKATEEIVFSANDRCNQENLIAQLKGGVHALKTPVNDLVSNWAYMVMASLAWSLKAFSALMVPVSPRHAAEHEAEKRTWLRMEFATFRAAVIEMPCQIIRSGGRLIYRLLSWNPWQGMFLRLVERLQGCWLF
jgi:Transposase DDE domain group 1